MGRSRVSLPFAFSSSGCLFLATLLWFGNLHPQRAAAVTG